MIDWSRHFDRIWCISYTGFPERRAGAERELKRVGILDSGIFGWQRTVPTIFNDILFDVTKKRKLNDCLTKGCLSCLFGHYSCMKTSLGLGDRRILILEDDVRFRKDVGEVERGIGRLPSDSDIVLFDWFARIHADDRKNLSELERMKSNSVNEVYSRYDHLWGADCYMMSDRAMEDIVRQIECKFYPIDLYTSYLSDDHGLNRYFCVDQIAVQADTARSNNSEIYGPDVQATAYGLVGVDLSKFNLEDSPK